MRERRPATLALTVLFAVQSFVFSARVAASCSGGPDAADAELAVLIDRYHARRALDGTGMTDGISMTGTAAERDCRKAGRAEEHSG